MRACFPLLVMLSVSLCLSLFSLLLDFILLSSIMAIFLKKIACMSPKKEEKIEVLHGLSGDKHGDVIRTYFLKKYFENKE